MSRLRWWLLCLRYPQLRMFETKPAPERTLDRLRERLRTGNWSDPL